MSSLHLPNTHKIWLLHSCGRDRLGVFKNSQISVAWLRWSSKVTPRRTLGTSPVDAGNDAVRCRMVTCAPATGKTVPAVVVLMPPPAVPSLERRTRCAPALLPPALPLVVLVAGVDMNFIRRLLTSVIRSGFQRPFFGFRAVLRRSFFGVFLWSFFSVRAFFRRPFFGVVIWFLSSFCCCSVSKIS